MYPGHRLQPSNQRRQRCLDWTGAQWSKVFFSDESKFCISFINQGLRVWRKRGEAQNPSRFRSSVNCGLEFRVLCWCWSTVVYQLYGDADFIFFSRTGHLPTLPNVPVPGLRSMVSPCLIGPRESVDTRPSKGEELKQILIVVHVYTFQ